jgi:hypothetical protein
MNIYNNIIITATNSLYFDSLLTLISSIHQTSNDLIDQIYVYNLGLNNLEIDKLYNIQKVTVLNFSEIDKASHPKFMEPKSYVYKIHCLYHSIKLGNNILWIDSGAMFLKSCKDIFIEINNNHIFLVGDTHINKNYTHSDCIKYTGASDSELNDKQLWAGLVGYKTNGKYLHFINEAYTYAMIPGCLDGNQENHRHDQSILSILASRYNISRHNIDIYGYWTDANRSLQNAIELGSVVFTHRRGHDDKSHIIYKS